jgi:hypothetical protein
MEHNEKCPFCKTPWHITHFNMKTWRDCKKCNEKSEELLKRWADRSKWHDSHYDNDDNLNEFLYSLNKKVSDDEEDWFF